MKRIHEARRGQRGCIQSTQIMRIKLHFVLTELLQGKNTQFGRYFRKEQICAFMAHRKVELFLVVFIRSYSMHVHKEVKQSWKRVFNGPRPQNFHSMNHVLFYNRHSIQMYLTWMPRVNEMNCAVQNCPFFECS